MPPSRAPSLTPLALAALDLLQERDLHPYEMHQVMRERWTDRVVKLKAGSLYHAIERLAANALVEVVETSREGRRPERTVYRITESGRVALTERLRVMLAERAEEYPEFPLAVGMLNALERDDAMAQLLRRTIALELEVGGLERLAGRLTELGLPKLYQLDISYRIAVATAELNWTNELLRGLREGSVAWVSSDQPHDHRTGLTLLTHTDEEAG
jgi:DNA-binding PadR family transcriptional regulator